MELSDVLNTQLFDFEKASESAGWIKELTAGGHATHTPETEESMGLHHLLILDDYHFMQKISSMLEQMPENIVRTKGIVWLAQYNDVACLLSQAGSSCNIHPVTYWLQQ